MESSEEQRQFNGLSKQDKLSRLNNLIQKSQVFSNIIADTILNSSVKRELQQPTPEVSPPPNKRKRAIKKGQKIERKKPKTDVLAMLTSKTEIKATTKDAKRAIEQAQEGQRSTEQPRLVTGGTLKPYQLDGLRWLFTLYENGLNGILADEMGLGKTIQCISLLSYLIENGVTGPFLVVVPLSTLSNWINEFHKFAPEVTVFKYHAEKQERALMDLKRLSRENNVIVTTYDIVNRDFSQFQKVNWKYLMVDEGHRLKNRESLLIQNLKQLSTANRLIITGTPLQNNLNELWSLLNFILPDIFTDLHLFQQWFNFEELTNFERDEEDEETKKFIKMEIQENLIRNLHTILKPFILRRIKADVIKDLPPKKEYLIHVGLTPLQKKMYADCMNKQLSESMEEVIAKQYLQYNFPDISLDVVGKKKQDVIGKRLRHQSYREAESDDEFGEGRGFESDDEPVEVTPEESFWDFHSRITKLPPTQLVDEIGARSRWLVRHKSLKNPMMQLRNISNSPYVYFDPIPLPDLEEKGYNKAQMKFFDVLVENSAKFQVLEQLTETLFKNGSKFLVFSQFTRVLDLIQDWYTFKGIDVCRIDGNSSQEDREQQIASFYTEKSSCVFLLSTRSGGLGINLVPADTVILFDSDWNPQMDLQAIDRVHRIGQTKPVKIFRLVTRHTIEEIMLTRSASKRFLEKLVIQMGQFKFNKLKKVMGGSELNDMADINVSELLAMSKINFEQDDEKVVTEYPLKPDKPMRLSKQEMDELFDRSPQCYSVVDKIFPDVTIYETINNLDQ